MRYARTMWAILAKDMAAELHTWEALSAMLVFSLLAILAFGLALDLSGETARDAAPGVLWTTLLLAGTLGLNRSLVKEQQSGSLEALLLAPVDRGAILIGKVLGNLLTMGVVALALLPVLGALLGAPLLSAGVLLVILLGIAGYATVGTLVTAMAVHTRAREVMLPVLLLPLSVPILVGGVQATGALMEGAALAEVSGWLGLLVAFDLVMLAVALLTFGYVVEA
ncbi:MAG: heme exporter protein CcmB [Anaerolineae bacterium]